MFLKNNKIKYTSSLESAFQSHIELEKIRIMRVMAALGTLLYLVFFIADIWAIPSALHEVYMIRAFVICVLILSYAFTYTSLFVKLYDYFLPIPYLLSALGVEAMIYLSKPTDHASNVYFAGIILVIMILFAWSHLKKAILIVTTTVIIGMYIAIEINNRGSSTAEYLPVLLPNLFFLVGAAIIGMATQIIRDSYLRQNFFLQQSLKDAYEKKSVEARDNEYLANHDPLTDLPNRRYMTELLNNSLEEASQNKKVLVIMFIDLNGFKKVNDLYGHSAGDEVLVIVAKRLELAIRKGDHLSRLGGDEYLLGLMMEKENLNEIEAMANKYIHIISQPMNVEGLRVKIGASVGVAAYPIHGNNIESLMAIADQRMYKAKKYKSNGKFFEDSTQNNKDESVVIFPGNAKSKKR